MEKFNKDTGHAILTAAKLDNLLQQLLLHALPRMSNGLAKSLFDRGPLGTFSAKIDLARALGLIDTQTRRELRVKLRLFSGNPFGGGVVATKL
jgi:hypothetical protein